MSRRNANHRPRPGPRPGRGFVLYVEGPGDRGVLEAWARQVSAPLARAIAEVTVILGGRRPERAVEQFREFRRMNGSASGLCLLDRDQESLPPAQAHREPGLRFHTWRRRHIESYLLVPEAIRRALRLPREDPRLTLLFRVELPRPNDEKALRVFDAKAVFARHGPLWSLRERRVPPSRVARAMKRGELHSDVLDLLELIQEGLGQA